MPLRKISCPHCFRPVFVNSDAVCPACQKNTNEIDKETFGLIPVDFVDGEKLPPYCVVCANYTDYYLEIGEKNPQDDEDKGDIIARLWALIGGWISIDIKPKPFVKEYKISIRVPTCQIHRNSKALTPVHIDYDVHRITIPVHRIFFGKYQESKKQ